VKGTKMKNEIKNYSLINVIQIKKGYFSGVWVQHAHAVTLDEALERARATEKANSNRIIVAVVDKLSNCCPDYSPRRFCIEEMAFPSQER